MKGGGRSLNSNSKSKREEAFIKNRRKQQIERLSLGFDLVRVNVLIYFFTQLPASLSLYFGLQCKLWTKGFSKTTKVVNGVTPLL